MVSGPGFSAASSSDLGRGTVVQIITVPSFEPVANLGLDEL